MEKLITELIIEENLEPVSGKTGYLELLIEAVMWYHAIYNKATILIATNRREVS